MQRRKPCCSIGLIVAWLLAGPLSSGCAQSPVLPILPLAKIRFSSANLEEDRPVPLIGICDFIPPRKKKPYSCFPSFFKPSSEEPPAREVYFSFPKRGVLQQPLHVLDDSLFKAEASARDALPVTRTPRLQMFRMPTGFLATPIGMENDDEEVFGGDDPANKSAGDDDAVQVNVGRHVPNLGMYRPGDPGGLGYYRVHSQVRIFDAGSSSMCLGLQAYTPIGQGKGEVLNGPTTLIPNLSCFQELYPGTALHAYVGAKPVTADGRWRDELSSGFRCGVAVQQPLPLFPCTAEQGMFVFVQTLGQCSPDALRGDVHATTWEFIPGVQWRLNSACWMSMGLSHHNFLSCAWQY